MILTTLASLALTLANPQHEFCSGFEEGYRTIAGSDAIVPICPDAPIMEVGQTAFRVGLLSGVEAACRRFPDRC